ncbi:hypothetical protein GCM10028810_55440 [Spirosoma litoris]
MAFVPIYILILGFTIIIDYFAGILIEQSVGKKRHGYLLIILLVNIGTLDKGDKKLQAQLVDLNPRAKEYFSFSSIDYI